MKQMVWWTMLLCATLLLAGIVVGQATGETISWTNPTTGVDNTGATVPLTTTEQAALKNNLRYKLGTGMSTLFGTTTGGKASWTGTLPVAEGVLATYTVSAALLGADGIERESAESNGTVYTRPFPPGKTPGAPSGVTISLP